MSALSPQRRPTFTPGPWFLSKSGRYVRYKSVNLSGPDYNVADLAVFGGPADEADANAALIAAAPDLYEAAKKAYEYIPDHASDCEGHHVYEEESLFEDVTGCTCFVGELRAALLKATAEAQS